jgi:hypothetical protein
LFSFWRKTPLLFEDISAMETAKRGDILRLLLLLVAAAVGESLHIQRRLKGGSSDSGSTDSFLVTSVSLLIVAVVVLAAGAYWYYQRVQAQMRDQVRQILSEYIPLNDLDDNDL